MEPCPQVKCLIMQQTPGRVITLSLLLSLRSYFFSKIKQKPKQTTESAGITKVESEMKGMNNACKLICPVWQRYPQCTAVNVEEAASPFYSGVAV